MVFLCLSMLTIQHQVCLVSHFCSFIADDFLSKHGKVDDRTDPGHR